QPPGLLTNAPVPVWGALVLPPRCRPTCSLLPNPLSVDCRIWRIPRMHLSAAGRATHTGRKARSGQRDQQGGGPVEFVILGPTALRADGWSVPIGPAKQPAMFALL